MMNDSDKVALVEASGRRFVVEKAEDCSMSSGWKKVIATEISARPSTLAFHWDDVLIRRTPGLRLDPYEVRWPTPDALFLSQADNRQRCAIDQEVLTALACERKISSDRDTSAALAYLAGVAPERLTQLTTVCRYTRSVRAQVYKPKPAPAPRSVAKSISVIINYRDHPDLMERCIRGIAAQRMTAFLELILINNQSSPDSKARVARAAEALDGLAAVRHIDYDKPFNKSAQDNLGVALASADVTILLNNDAALITPTCLQTSANWTLDQGVACAGPQIWGDHDRIVSNGVFIRAEQGVQQSLIRENEFPVFAASVRRTAGISFCCAAVSKATWAALGPLDEEVFTSQYNDADFFVRALERGYCNIHVGTEICRHEPGQSESRSKQSTEARLKMFRERYPTFGAHERIDFDYIKMRSIPKLEDKYADRDMRLVRGWRRARAALAPVYARMRGATA